MRTTTPIVFTGVVLATLIHATASGRAQAEQVRRGTVQTTQPNIDKRRLSPDDVRKVAPALEAYTQERLYGEIWKRPGLAPRDRSLVTIAALIARDQSPALTYYFDQALENGVKPREISEIITHLAFYAGWVRTARHSRGSTPRCRRATASAQRTGRGRTGQGGQRTIRHDSTGGRPIHHRRAVPRPLAPAGSGAAGSESRDRQRADRDGTGGTTAVSPPPSNGPRADAAR